MLEKFSKHFINKEHDVERGFTADQITEKRSLGAGAHGDVAEVAVLKDGVVMNFALKDYAKSGQAEDESSKQKAQQHTEAAYQSYLEAKKAGIKVFPTVRISKDKPQLLMTLGTQGGWFVISKDSYIGWEKVVDISNLDSLIESMGENVIKSVRSNIELRKDSYFFLSNTKKPTEIDFVVGDYERLEQSNRTPEKLFKKNMASVRDVIIQTLLEKYLKIDSDEAFESLSSFITQRVQEFTEKHMLEFLKKD